MQSIREPLVVVPSAVLRASQGGEQVRDGALG